MKKGIFITFEGCEGSGKSTQAKLLYRYFKKQGHDVILTYEPGGVKISNKIRDILLSAKNKNLHYKTELLLYLAARAQHVEEKIKPALKEGKIVICDRFSDSTFAYQGTARKIDHKTIEFINNFATSGLLPDIVILIDIPPDIGFKRIKKHKYDRLEREKLSFHKKVRNGYLLLAKKYPQRIKIVNGLEDTNELHKKIIQICSEILISHQG